MNSGTFNGGILNAAGGTVVGNFAGLDASGVAGVISFGGGISNAGLVLANSYGVFVQNVSTFSGGIANSGSIAVSSSGTVGDGIYVNNFVQFSGGVRNSGSISAAYDGVNVNVGSTFLGGITNSGTISASLNGIIVSAVSQFGDASLGGGITNSSTISAGYGTNNGGIIVNGVTQFYGGVTNSGLISGGVGIYVLDSGTFAGGILNAAGGTVAASFAGLDVSGVNGVSNFSGGISNAGQVLAQGYGVYVANAGTFSGGVTNSGTVSAGVAGVYVSAVSQFGSSSAGGGISNSGLISVASGTTKAGILVGHVTQFYGGITNSGIISAGLAGIYVLNDGTFNGGILNAAGGTVAATYGLDVSGINGVSSFAGGISNAGLVSAKSYGVFVSNVGQFSGGITNSGTVSSAKYGIYLGSVGQFLNGLTNTGAIVAQTGIVLATGVSSFSGAIANSGTISGTGGVAIDVTAARNAITINQSGGLVSGAIKLSDHADVLNISGGSVAGDIVGAGSRNTVNFSLGSGNTFTYGSNFTSIKQVNVDSGTVYLNGAGNTATNLSVSSGGTVAGAGTINGPVAFSVGSGATFMPGSSTVGTSMNIVGGLTFASGATYAVNLNSATASFGNVTGSAALNGTVNASFAPGSYSSRRYTILNSTGGFGGTTFTGASASGLPAGYFEQIAYDSTHVYLDLLTGISLTGFNGNQQAVANALNAYLNNAGTLPPNFVTVFEMTGGNLSATLSQLAGEAATGDAKAAIAALTSFLGLMLDPFVDGRPDNSGTALGFAPEQAEILPPEAALAYAGVLKAPPKPPSLDQRWRLWGSAFGGHNKTNGDILAGTTSAIARNFGFAAGADYRATPDAYYGFALAGGGSNWGLAQGLGGGHSDAFMAGVYGKVFFGSAYVGANFAYANHWMNTNRTVLGNPVTGTFTGQSFGARFESGYRIALKPTAGLTPYAALQTQVFRTPSYSEADPNGSGFGLSYGAMSATDTRAELGARFDRPTYLNGMLLTLRARAAWAHDWATNPTLAATFQALPGATFIVNGAAVPKDSALASAGAELQFSRNWSMSAKFDGEFANMAQTYAGTGTLRYRW